VHVVGPHLFALEVFLSGSTTERPERRPKGSSDADVISEAVSAPQTLLFTGRYYIRYTVGAHCSDVGETE
jgi:hypothetical protein